MAKKQNERGAGRKPLNTQNIIVGIFDYQVEFFKGKKRAALIRKAIDLLIESEKSWVKNV